MSVAPVTDWRNYDSIYTERYAATPILVGGNVMLTADCFCCCCWQITIIHSYMGELTDATLPSYINGSLVTPQRSAAVKAPLFLAHGLSDDNVQPSTLQPKRRFTCVCRCTR